MGQEELKEGASSVGRRQEHIFPVARPVLGSNGDKPERREAESKEESTHMRKRRVAGEAEKTSSCAEQRDTEASAKDGREANEGRFLWPAPRRCRFRAFLHMSFGYGPFTKRNLS